MACTPARKFTLFAALTAAEALAALLWLLAIPGETSSALLLGLSARRLALAAIPLGLLVIALLLLLPVRPLVTLRERSLHWRVPRWAGLVWLELAALGAVIWISGRYSLGWTDAAAARMQPVLALLTVFCLQAALFVRPPREEPDTVRSRPLAGLLAAALAGLAVLSGVGVISGISVVFESRYYAGAGAPILPLQVLYAVFAALTLLLAARALPAGAHWRAAGGVLAGLILFALAAWMWLGVEIPDTHFTRPSNLPGETFWPYSDARIYDANAQQMLLGYGLAGGKPLPRPLYSFFLGLLHLLAGSSTRAVINAQTVVLALLPAGVYVLGRRLGHSAIGILAGLLVIFRETNQALLSPLYTLSSARMLMSELFTACFLVLLVILAARWLAQPDSRTRAVWTGVALGLTALIRTQVLLLAAVLIVFGAAALWRRWGTLLRVTATMLAAVLLVVLPWMSRNGLRSGAFVFEDPAYAARTLTAESGEPGGGLLQGIVTDPGGFVQRTAAHFTNSALSSLYQLPWRWEWGQTLEDYTADGLQRVFTPYWPMTAERTAGLAIHLLLIGVGLAAAMRTAGWGGLLPAGIYLGYALSSAAAGFSGWRFIQPVDWIVLLYWAAGVLALLSGALNRLGWRARLSSAPAAAREWSLPALAAVALAAGLLLPVGEALFPRAAVQPSRNDLLAELRAAAAGQDIQGVLDLAQEGGSVVLRGTLLYPMYLRSELDFARTKLNDTPLYETRPLLYFDVVGPGRTYVYLPVDAPGGFARHGQTVVVIGCRVGSRVQAAALLVEGEKPRWLLSSRPVPGECPAVTAESTE